MDLKGWIKILAIVSLWILMLLPGLVKAQAIKEEVTEVHFECFVLETETNVFIVDDQERIERFPEVPAYTDYIYSVFKVRDFIRIGLRGKALFTNMSLENIGDPGSYVIVCVPD
jgi:hypothetical protein